jgi:antitoxin Phd
MRQAQWQLQTAKAQLSELVEAALRGEPQRITRRGKDAVMVVSEESFLALKQSARNESADFVAHLLSMPRASAVSDAKASQKTPRTSSKPPQSASKLRLRDLDL